jgi:hypothetical protein
MDHALDRRAQPSVRFRVLFAYIRTTMNLFGQRIVSGAAALAMIIAKLAGNSTQAADSLHWDTPSNRVSAEVSQWSLTELLEQIAEATGWQILVEPGTQHTANTRFRHRLPGDALRLLLGDLSYALLPQKNSASRLYVFRTTLQEATQEIRPGPRHTDPTAKPIPNELIVTLKPGANIEELARKLGAKITGRADDLNTYRLEFDDAAAAQAAREALQNHPDVDSVDSNYRMRRPQDLDALSLSSGNPFGLRPKSSGNCNPVIGLIDTAVQPTGGPMDSFLLPSISVAGEFKPTDPTPTHGTSMFETVLRGLSLRQRETSVKVLPVDVYGGNATTTTFDVSRGVVQAINKGANIINLSLGSAGDSEMLRKVIQAGAQQGVVFLAAAGNQPTTQPTYPAAYPQVLAVTSGTRDGTIAPYANRGEFVDLVAPGTSMVNFNGQSWLVSGTSASTAFASGLAASLWDCNKMSPPQLGAAMVELLPVRR